MATTTLVTAEELELLPDAERYELIRGVLYPVSPAGRPHGRVMGNVAEPLLRHVREQNLGVVYVGDVGVILERDPDTVLGPDISFVRADRLPAGDGRGYMPFVPDLAIEIISPSQTRPEAREKVDSYLAAGVPHVWLFDPRRRTVTVFGGTGGVTVLTEDDPLDGGDLLPGFRLSIADVFR